jgi:hypothetical protein
MTRKDKHLLRELAKKQAEYANLPIMEERVKRWYNHNDLIGNDVMLHFEVWTCLNELMSPLEAETDEGRGIEWQLKHNMLNHEMVNDDRVVSKTYDINRWMYFKPFDIDVSTQNTEGIAYQFIHQINDLAEDFHKLKPSYMVIDNEGTLKYKEMLEDIFGDILPVRISCGSLDGSLTIHLIRLMGMENMFVNFMDYPELFKKMMNQLVDDYIKYYRLLEAENCLLLNNGNDGLGQGSFGFSNTLPKEKIEGNVLTKHMWGYMDSQETKGVSPESFAEFFYPYYERLANEFGLLSYGCCEIVDTYWENCLSKLPNLRKISISPWSDEEYMGNVLRGAKTIFHRKPSPNYMLGSGSGLDEEGFKAHIIKTLQAARGCKLEFSYRDVYLLGGDPTGPRRAIEIIRHLTEKYWR